MEELSLEPKFKLDQHGEDLTDHNGLAWIYLLCPYCNTKTKFVSVHTVVIKQPEEEYGIPRDFHTLASCENCGDVLYVKCSEIDFDPDWHFAYEFHHPRSVLSYSAADIPEIVWLSLNEAHICFNAGAYIATVVMCRRTIEAILRDKGLPKNLGLAKALQKVARDLTLHESMVQISDLIRLLGNIGAHASDKRIDEKDAKEAYELTQKLIDISTFSRLKFMRQGQNTRG